jgi:hypothetical protein
MMMLRMGIMTASVMARSSRSMRVIMIVGLMCNGFYNGVLMHMKHANQKEHENNAHKHPTQSPIEWLLCHNHAMREQMQHRHAEHESAHATHERLQSRVRQAQPNG